MSRQLIIGYVLQILLVQCFLNLQIASCVFHATRDIGIGIKVKYIKSVIQKFWTSIDNGEG